MAFDAINFEVQVHFEDNGGGLSMRTYGVVAGTEYADLVTALPTTIATIAATSDCLIYDYAIRSIWVNDTPTIPASGIQNENQALLTLKILGKPLDSATLSIPGAKPALFVTTSGPGANVVNMSSSLITNFVGLLEDGALLTVSDGDNVIIQGGKGKRRHTKNNNG